MKKFSDWLRHSLGYWLRLGIALAFLLPARLSFAQEGQPDGPVYVVQEGDALWDIALRFGISLDDLKQANGISDANQLASGARLVIPGLEGIQGEIVTQEIPFGETLRSLSRRYQVPEETLVRLNHLASPAELYAGDTLVIPITGDEAAASRRAMLMPGQSLLELAVTQGENPWKLVETNVLSGTWSALPGEVLHLPGGAASGEAADGAGALPEAIASITARPTPFLQGKAFGLRLSAPEGLSITGSFMGHELHFFEQQGSYIALQGVHALAEPGLYPLSLEIMLSDGTPFAFSQPVSVQSVDYPFDRPLTVDPATIDPAVTRPEDAEWAALSAPATAERLWDGVFRMPSPLDADYCLETNECWTSRFGNRRSYNGSPYSFFHTGLDFAGGMGTEIFAPAPGIVVFAGPLTVRGNATMIDHGWGVYTGYMHQSEIFVDPGDRVKPGDLIGLVGGTGRVEGPHLHWEVWVGGVQVDPLDWLKREYP